MVYDTWYNNYLVDYIHLKDNLTNIKHTMYTADVVNNIVGKNKTEMTR